MEDNYRYCKHKKFGVGSAIMTGYRRQKQNCLWMVQFQNFEPNEKMFYLTRDFTSKEEIEFISEDEATILYRQGRKEGKKKVVFTEKRDKSISDLLESLL